MMDLPTPLNVCNVVQTTLVEEGEGATETTMVDDGEESELEFACSYATNFELFDWQAISA